uniref:DNA endonuclease n=1 Tax=Pseudomonas phage Cygsa01 TaxID=3138529 RepID=A0AAU6W3X1_9VIRU
MKRTAWIGDLHMGVRSANHHFLDFQYQWLEWMVDQLIEQRIPRMVFVGDLFDVRKTMHGRVYEFLITRLIPLLERYADAMKAIDLEAEILAITGNHDITLRESNRISWVEMLNRLSKGLVQSFQEAELYTSPVDGVQIGMLPWINDENREASMKFLAETEAKVIVGHLELAGFPMYAGVPSGHGMEAGVFDRFDLVVTGHYHTRSERRNIHYIGSPYHLTWSDFVDGDNRGITILDHDTMEVSQINNPDWMTMFSVVTYDPKADYSKPELLDSYKGTIMKIVVEEHGTPAHMKKFLAEINKLELIDFAVIDKTIMTKGEDAAEEPGAAQEEINITLKTNEVISNYIDRQEMVSNPTRLKAIAADLLARAEARAA